MFEKDVPKYTLRKKAIIKANGVQTGLIIPQEELPKDKTKGYYQLLLKENGRTISSKNVFLMPFKNLDIPDPGLEFKTEIDNKKQDNCISKFQKFCKRGIYFIIQ